MNKKYEMEEFKNNKGNFNKLKLSKENFILAKGCSILTKKNFLDLKHSVSGWNSYEGRLKRSFKSLEKQKEAIGSAFKKKYDFNIIDLEI